MSSNAELPLAHHRSLSVVARNIEMSLDAILETLTISEDRRVLHRVDHVYTPDQRKAILGTIAEIRQILSEFVGLYDLAPSSVSEAQIVNAHFAHIWVMLQDSRPAKLRAYGELPNGSHDQLESIVGRLLESVERLGKEA